MVIDFIFEGASDLIFLNSDNFKKTLESLNITTGRLISAGGYTKLPKEILTWTNSDYVFIITDSDNESCVATVIENRIKDIIKVEKNYKKKEEHIFIIAIRELESWFLSDKVAMKKMGINFNKNTEQQKDAKGIIIGLLNKNKKRKGKIGEELIANKFIEAGFSIENAAKNNNSAKYFLTQLEKVSIK